MAKHLQQKKSKKLRKLILGNISTDEEEVIPDTPEAILVGENLKADDINVNISNTGTNVIMGLDNAKPDDSENAKIKSPKTTKGDDQGIVIPTSEIIVPLPPITSTTYSPTFENIINTPFTSLFSSQSTDPPKTTSPADETMENETDTKGFGGTFEALKFDDTEEEFPDHMLMTMKQFKIQNSKLSSIFQTQADIEGSSSVSSLEVDSMLKVFEGRVTTKVSGMIRESKARVLEKVDFNDQTNDNRMSSQRKDFLHEVKDLKAVTRERHVLYVQEVKKVREDVNLQIAELREDMQKEVQVVQQDYASINQKVDIICNDVTRFVKLYETMNPQVINLSVQTAKHFDELKFVQFEAILHKQLSPLVRISNLLPAVSDAPPAFTGMQGGEKKLEFTKAGENIKESQEMKTDAKVVGKVFLSNVSTTKPIIVSAGPVTSTVITTTPMTRPK
ncbi:unnamed protein product [Lactuca saligna]|uniref:Uncharacterized protein n=1 Tax=Lactuca saligna TaxID=75948 RepID=A0AA36EP94_LACSI|nr:unnamed protein product [Lactuca saligna]